MSAIEWLKKESALIGRHPWEFAGVALIARGAAFGMSTWHYQGRIDGLMETLETRQFPTPVVRHIPVPVTDPTSAAIIAGLNRRLDLQGQTIQDLTSLLHQPAATPAIKAKAKGTAPTPKPAPLPQATAANTFSNQSGGIAMGSNGSIGTANVNGLPARSKFAAPLGAFYTEGYLLEQRIGEKGATPAQIDVFDHDGGAWQSKVVAFMNANMCSDAAAYFLQSHRAGMSYGGMSEKQNSVFDAIARNLDNLSDIKRNDAWDCK